MNKPNDVLGEANFQQVNPINTVTNVALETVITYEGNSNKGKILRCIKGKQRVNVGRPRGENGKSNEQGTN